MRDKNNIGSERTTFKMVEINWIPQSLYDIDNIAEFIARDSVKYANI
ncbi:MAG TPA: hypothetical protein PKA90_09705 [Ignavibacteria bacterium]|nr:hypothetical protein [Ignavibacteria bacterium]HMR40690.1 hypothetical protein [Ignavibacteria bacterium]